MSLSPAVAVDGPSNDQSASQDGWRGQAFGLSIHADYPVMGLQGAPDADRSHEVRLELISDAELDGVWRTSEARDARRVLTPEGETAVLTRCHPELGYLVNADGYGRHLVDLDGRRIRSAPAPILPERWQGLLAAQALPLAATLQGIEVFHASAVVIAGQVLALTGPSGAGKSTLATRLILLGARFFADDVLAVEKRGGQIVAHAGLGIIRLRAQADAAVPTLAAQQLATVVGEDEKTLVELPRDVGTLPLRSLYLLQVAAPGEPSRIAASIPDPRRLLASTYNLSVRTPDRLARQLELVSHLGQRTGMFSAEIQRDEERATAHSIFEHAAREVLE